MKTSFLQRAYLAFCWLLVIGGIVLFSFKALNGNFAAENDEMFHSFEKMEQREKAPISDLYRESTTRATNREMTFAKAAQVEAPTVEKSDRIIVPHGDVPLFNFRIGPFDKDQTITSMSVKPMGEPMETPFDAIVIHRSCE